MNIDEIIEMMEELLDNSSAVPFSNKKLIDCDQMRDYIDNMRLNLPGEIKKAKETESQKDAIIAEANNEADKIKKQAAADAAKIQEQSEQAVELAKQKAMEIVSESEIIRQAKEYAAQLIKEAQEQADEIVADAKDKDGQIRRALSESVSKTLSEAQEILQKNLEDVTSTKEAIEKLNAPAEDENAETKEETAE